MSEGATGGDAGGAGATGGEAGGEATSGGLGSQLAGQTGDGGDGGGTPEFTAPAWAEGASTDELAVIQSKQWAGEGKGPLDVLRSYMNLEKLHGAGADQLVKLPNWDNAEEVAAYRERLGVPTDPSTYETPTIELSTGTLDPSMLQEISHRVGHTPAQHGQMSEAIGEVLKASVAQAQQAAEARDQVEQKALESDWGAKLTAENQQVAIRAMDRFGIEPETVDKIQTTLGYRATMELLVSLGRGVGEHQTGANGREGGESRFGMTKEVARAQIKELQRDQGFFQRLKAGDASAREQWKTLQQIAFS